MQESARPGVLHGEQLPVEETAEDGQVRGRLRDELLPGAEDQEAEGPVDMQRRDAVHQRHRDHTEVRVRQKMLLTTRPLHRYAPTRRTTTAAAHATGRRPAARPVPRYHRPATRGRRRPAAAPRLDGRRVRVRGRVRRRLRHHRTADRRHLVDQRLYISSSAVTTPAP